MSASSDNARNKKVWRRRIQRAFEELHFAVASMSREEWQREQEYLRRARERKRSLVFRSIHALEEEKYPITDHHLSQLCRR